ncbi:antiporter [[Pantoea] beijingensis]|uniref:Arginine/agmatine antiporter n=2 Tax=[Pantoea] beijingensis TaxID=1324864 RepID=A0A443IH34_9GAMM|nr:antiporter [[Pantoea] beijingensis]
MDKFRIKKNQMGLFALTMMTASNMMGSGVFMLPATLARIGAISIWGWALAFLAIAALALIFCKTSELFPCNGGIIANITASFGPFVGLQMTLFYWLSTWIGNCALLLAGVGYLSYFFPSLHNPLYGTGACILILWLSVIWGLRGAKLVGYTQLFTGGCMVLAILSIGVLGWGHFDAERYHAAWNLSGVSNYQAIINAAMISLWGFLGIESASVSFSQVKNPRRTVPLATLLGLGIAGLCYASSTNVMIGILPHHALINSSSPFADSACAMWGTNAGLAISVMVVIACFGAIPGWQILQTEVPKAAAEEGLLPAFFARTNRHGVPAGGLVFTASLMTLLLLLTLSPNLQNQFTTIITLAVSASLFPYAFAAVSLPVMIALNHQKKNTTFYYYCCLSLVALCFISLAFITESSSTVVWGIVLQIATLPLYLLYIARRHRRESRVSQQSLIGQLNKELL